MVQGKYIPNAKLGYQIVPKQTKSKQLRNIILYAILEHQPHQVWHTISNYRQALTFQKAAKYAFRNASGSFLIGQNVSGDQANRNICHTDTNGTAQLGAW